MAENTVEKVYAFGESDFLVDDFNAEQFLSKYSATCDLDDLKSDLGEFLTRCENAIMSIMNRDYESFISLAMRLNGLKEKLQGIRSPLEDSRDVLNMHKENLLHECELLYNLLRRHKELEDKKKHLSRFIRLNSLLSTSESILQDINSKPVAQLDREDLLKIERICRNISQVNTIIASYAFNEFSYLIICKDRNDVIRKSCLSLLRSLFERTIQGNQANKNLTMILKCYFILDMVEDIEVYYRENYIIPFIDPLITRERLDGSTRNSCSGLSLLLDTIVNYVESDCMAVIRSAETILLQDEQHRQHYVFDFFLHSIWTPIVDFFFRRIGTIFICGSHAIFQHNYSLCDAFAKRMAGLCNRPHSFWNYPKTHAFYSKWELNVYATSLSLDMMTSQISVLLQQKNQEEKETTTSIQQKKKQEVPFMLESTNVTYSLITHVYTSDVYIPQCSKELLQLALALLKRYYNYVETTMETLVIPTKESMLPSTLSPQPSTPSASTSYSTDETSLSLLTSLLHDLVLLHTALSTFFQKTLANPVITPAEKTLCLRALQLITQQEGEQQITHIYSNLLLLNLYNASSALSNVRSITGSYRMTNKPAPSASSFYVSRILYNYDGFLKKYKDCFTQDELRFERWKEEFVQEVCSLFRADIEDILKTISRMEEVLSKHRKRTQIENGERADETDEEKMKHQLLLDVTALKSHISDLGIAIPDAYSDLFTLVYDAYSHKK